MPSDAPTMAGARYHDWHAGGDGWLDDETVERLREHHGDAELFPCENCGQDVHVVSGGYREQVKAWVRYGPLFVCGECIARAFGLEHPRDVE